MSNAAIYFHPDGYDTSRPRLLGRHSAGESFLRGYLRHAQVDRYYFWNRGRLPQRDLDALVDRIHPPARPITWIDATNRNGLRAAGVLYTPMPDLGPEAWRRRIFGSRSYAICGITHTTATAGIMRLLPEMLIAPTEGYDALICTSGAVRASVETQLSMMREYMGAEYGARRRPEPMLATIPLGVNADDFAHRPDQRKAWRERLGISDDAVVALYVGRFNVRAKMNPALMAIALERAAQATARPIHWISAGWAGDEAQDDAFAADLRPLCPSVQYHQIDGRPPEVRFSIWSAADFFISYSDNIQETFGLTPIEAMAAGLPCVVTDWNGYRDTVRHGEDGFRIPTLAPPAGQGMDLAYQFADEMIPYQTYVGATAQFVAVDYEASTAAIGALVESPDLRRRMGAAARARALETFDWQAVIPRYQALWAEQDARRRAAPPDGGSRDNPFAPDPYSLFASYPSAHLTLDHRLLLTPGMTGAAARALLALPLTAYSPHNRPSPEEAEQTVAWLAGREPTPLRDLVASFPANRQSFIHRGILWLARYGVVAILPPAQS